MSWQTALSSPRLSPRWVSISRPLSAPWVDHQALASALGPRYGVNLEDADADAS